MPRSPLGRTLRRVHAQSIYALQNGRPIADVRGRLAELSRRRFLLGSSGLGAALLLPAVGCSSASTPSSSNGYAAGLNTIVVGAGLAGLTCAHRLTQAGANVTVHEAADRIAGRTRTLRNFFADGRTGESGAEAVNSDHRAMRSLLNELGLDLEDLWEGYPDDAGSVTSFGGNPYSVADVFSDWKDVAPALQRDFSAAGADIRWDSHNEAAVALDRMSLAEWIDTSVAGGRGSRMGQLIEITMLSEWAGAAEDQSALNLVTMVGPAAGSSMDLLGGSDERWHVAGGSDRVADKLRESVGDDAVELESSLVAVRSQGAGVRCTFDHAGSTTDVDADRLVLALPFTALRAVDLDGVQLSDRKRKTIAEQPMGTNSKLHLEFNRRAWRDNRADGDSTSDTSLMVTWEEVISEPGPTGVLVAFTGGEPGASYNFARAHGEAPRSLVEASAGDLETVFGPSTPAAATGRGWLDSWVDDPYTSGSYSFWATGQYTEIRGAGATPEGPIHFCGEHTSLDHQGFMNGAVESGDRAATEILDA